MAEDIFNNRLAQDNPSQNSEMKQLRNIISLIIHNWYFFVVSLIIAFALAYLHNTNVLPTYRTSGTLLIEEGKESSSITGDELLEGFGLTGSMRNMDNQIMILSSRNLVSQTIRELQLEKEYFFRRLFKKKSFYPENPIEIVPLMAEGFPKDTEIRFKFLGNNSFKLDTKPGSSFELHIKSSFGEIIEKKGTRFYIKLNDNKLFAERKYRKTYFIWYSRDRLVDIFLDRLVIEPATKKGTVVRVSLDGTNKIKDLNFLNKYMQIYMNMSLEKKNLKAIRTIQFIDDQLIGISDSLIITEEKLQRFRSRYKVMDLSAQGQSIIDQAVTLENELNRRKIEADYYNYLSEYLSSNDSSAVLIAPATIGIVDPGLTRLVSDLADLQAQYYSKSLGEMNPMQGLLAQRVRNTEEALAETLKGVIRANNLALTDLQEQIRNLNAQASALPVTERRLLGIERKYQLNNEMYTYLMEKKAQAQIQKASNVADNEIIDIPRSGSKPLKPRTPVNFLIALLAGFAIPFSYISIYDSLNMRIKDVREIQKMVDIPVSGYIPHNYRKKDVLILQDSETPFAESFRSIRTRMQFFTKEVKSPIILVTSSMPGDGKTSVAINLAYTYSLLEETAILLDFDLRSPSIHKFFNIENETGISTWIIGKDDMGKIIAKTEYKNLDIITAGPVPPNPAELTSLTKINDLMKALKDRYDYIVVDTSPIGIFSDVCYLASMADANLLVTRQNQTNKENLLNTIKEARINCIKNMSIVFNDLTVNGYNYGYAKNYKYAYRNKNKNKKKTLTG